MIAFGLLLLLGVASAALGAAGVGLAVVVGALAAAVAVVVGAVALVDHRRRTRPDRGRRREAVRLWAGAWWTTVTAPRHRPGPR
ncbi:hypothetical protein ABZ714_19615 [Streptomyces sp. NPDC006798]|uniref:hypothetical protein n=1 Tax=Streptomyces sp. NPDC006798 TaxID=3155462 RepID=UPI0033D97DFD